MELQQRKGYRPIYYKAAGQEIAVEGNRVSGYLAAWGNRDFYGDVLLKGCCAKSIMEHGPASASPLKIAYLYQHDMDRPLGRFEVLKEDDKGLYFEAEFDPIELADQVRTQYATGTLNQHSIGFNYVWDKMEYEDKTESYIVKEIILMEGSVVTIGANENTPFTGFKAVELENIHKTLYTELEGFLSGIDPREAMKARKTLSQIISLAEVDTAALKALVSDKPKELDIDKLIHVFKQIK